MTGTVWMYDVPGSGYHDINRCECDRHCRNCFCDLDESAATVARLINQGHLPEADRIGPRTRYCSTWCRNHAKRERALDRAISAVTVKD